MRLSLPLLWHLQKQTASDFGADECHMQPRVTLREFDKTDQEPKLVNRGSLILFNIRLSNHRSLFIPYYFSSLPLSAVPSAVHQLSSFLLL